MKKSLVILASLITGAAMYGAEVPKITDPYGVCAHITESEFPRAAQTLDRMKEANLRWVRCDFAWEHAEYEQGKWRFDQFQQTAELAKQNNIAICAVLNYDVKWAMPAWKHMDLWCEYVRQVVTALPGLRYWEVWNEQNSDHFWRDTPNPAVYAEMLKRSYEVIKKVNPDAVVLYGGTAGVPLRFIEESLKAGAGNYFDVMNIHPYHWEGNAEMMFSDVASLREVMAKYGVGEKPIWITEVGWATARLPEFYRNALPPVFKKAGIDYANSTVAIVNDPVAGYFESPNFNADYNLGMFKKVERVRLNQLKGLDVKRYPVLIASTSEMFPAACLPQVLDYVKRGGTLLQPLGLPFYHDVQLDGKGGSKRVEVGDKYIKDFHIGWDASWTNPAAPPAEKWQKLAPGFENAFDSPFRPIGRFLTGNNLKPGDKFVPIILAGNDTYTGAVFGLYQLNSDLKGNIIIYCGTGLTDSTTVKRQGELFPRSYIVALGAGVERVFWYNFRSWESSPDEREAHFGILHADMSAKPAYTACKVLTQMLPDGSTRPEITRVRNAYLASWKKPDGTQVYALWAADSEEKVKLSFQGEAKCVNHLGEAVTVKPGDYTAGPSVVYMTGAEKVSIR